MAANKATFNIKLEIDEEKINALKLAEERFDDAKLELHRATIAVRDALYDMRDSLSVKKED